MPIERDRRENLEDTPVVAGTLLALDRRRDGHLALLCVTLDAANEVANIIARRGAETTFNALFHPVTHLAGNQHIK